MTSGIQVTALCISSPGIHLQAYDIITLYVGCSGYSNLLEYAVQYGYAYGECVCVLFSIIQRICLSLVSVECRLYSSMYIILL